MISGGQGLLLTESMSQSVLGKSASAGPQVEGSGEVPLVMSGGIAERGKSQVRMPSDLSSMP